MSAQLFILSFPINHLAPDDAEPSTIQPVDLNWAKRFLLTQHVLCSSYSVAPVI